MDDGEACGAQPVAEGVGHRGRGRPHVVADHDALSAREVFGVQDGAEVEADRVGELLVELVRVDAADVVGLEDATHANLRGGRIDQRRYLATEVREGRAGRPGTLAA